MREARVDRMTDVFMRVNLPAFMLRVYEHGKVIREQRVIIGTNKLDDDKVTLVQGHINRTKIFGTRLYQVIVNPTWILPRRVEQGELLTSVEDDPDYLAKKNIRKVRLGSGEDVLVQGAGGGDVLGEVKFLLEESNAVYLHDTDKRGLFKKRRRDFSHGCMRVEGAEEFAKWLLERDGAAAADVERAFASKAQPFPFELKTPINLVTEYVTVDLTANGEPIFLDDIYKYDDAYWNDKLPPTVTLPWGSALLRPRWVPLVDAKTVAGWKAEGKSAPRDLGPDGKPKKPAPPKPEESEP
jgi:murein L,D-transpeptidase YcbB/YkuD